MDCQKDLARDELIEQYLNGQMQPAEQNDFEIHLLECSLCQQTLEVLQAVREDLVQRAHEIRSNSGNQQVRLRWKWAALAFTVLMVGALGVMQWGKLHKKQAIITVPPAAPSSQSPSPQAANSSFSASPVNLDHGGILASSEAVRSGSNTTPKSAAIGPDHPKETVAPVTQQPGKTEVAEVPPQDSHAPQTGGTTPPHSGQAMPPVSGADDAAAIELFKLGMVKAPPPTFASFKAGATPHKGDMVKGYYPNDVEQGHRVEFRKAMMAYVKKHYDDATSLLENSLNTEPDAPDVNFYYGICKLLQSHPADSLAPLQKAIDKPNSTLTQAAHFYLAKAYLQTGNLAKAETELNAAAEITGFMKEEAAADLARLHAVLAAK